MNFNLINYHHSQTKAKNIEIKKIWSRFCKTMSLIILKFLLKFLNKLLISFNISYESSLDSYKTGSFDLFSVSECQILIDGSRSKDLLYLWTKLSATVL